MRKIVVSTYLSLDGVMEDPAWSAPYWSDDIAKFKFDELFASDALLLGRITYDGFAAAWPSMTDEDGFANRMNSLPKYVVSTTLKDAQWNNSNIISEHIIEEISKLKEQPGQDILVYGSGKLVETLMKHNLVDEYHLLVYPIVLGNGKKFFKDGINSKLNLVDVKSFDSGVISLTYIHDVTLF